MKDFLKLLLIASRFIALASALDECIGEFCFTLPDSNDTKNFNEAKSWCKSINSSLAVSVDEIETNDSMLRFLDKWRSNATELIYIDVNLRQNGRSYWYLLNGSRFESSGYVINGGKSNINRYLLYSYIGEAIKSEGLWRLVSSRPDDLRNYICEINATYCTEPNSTHGVFVFRGKCYRKYESENVTWYKARKRCIQRGGDLASFYKNNDAPREPDAFYYPDFNTSVLDISLYYWVGLRWNNWAWISPSDDGNETLYDGWSDGKPNNTAYQCVCLDPNGKPRWSWTDCDCTIRRQFLCLKKVATTPSTTSLRTTSSTSPASNQKNQQVTDKRNNIIIGVVIGVGGAILVAIAIIIIVFVVRRRKEPLKSPEAQSIRSKQITNVSGEMDGPQLTEKEHNYAEIVSRTKNNEADTGEQSTKGNEIIYADLDHSMKS